MSGYGSKGGSTKVVRDWYKVLQISPSSSIDEIKVAYYKMAQLLHPDKHNGDVTKLEQFKLVNNAYDILSNKTKRNEYDMQMGYHYTSSSSSSSTSYKRKTPIHKDYRKVYTSRPPPEWKMTWDHVKHYEMHYGNGLQKEAMKQVIRTAERDGSLQYQSALGKGFTFNHLHEKNEDTTTTTNTSTMNGSTTTDHKMNKKNMQYNPYSKNPQQGPPKIIFNYEEIIQNGTGTGSKRQILKQERVIYDLHLRRFQRYEQEIRMEQQQQQQQQQSSYSSSTENDKNTSNASGTSTDTNSNTSSSSTNQKTKASSIYARYDWRYKQQQQQEHIEFQRKQQQQQRYTDQTKMMMDIISSMLGTPQQPPKKMNHNDNKSNDNIDPRMMNHHHHHHHQIVDSINTTNAKDQEGTSQLSFVHYHQPHEVQKQQQPTIKPFEDDPISYQTTTTTRKITSSETSSSCIIM